MFAKEFDDINLADLHALVDQGISEGRQLEFKRDHYGRKDEDRREFAADVSAMANAQGGYLLIGINEQNGSASDVCGVAESDPDGLIRKVSESIRTSFEPPLIEFRIKWVAIEAGRGVLVIKIARSWSAPHRVTFAKDYRFFIRDENGKHPMSVDELRRAFLFASEIEERIRRFRVERLDILSKGEGPLNINNDEGNAQIILHVVPRATFTDGIRIELKTGTLRPMYWPFPLEACSMNYMYSLDGLVCHSYPYDLLSGVNEFSTLFYNGIAEAVSKIYVFKEGDYLNISLSAIEQAIIFGLSKIFNEYKSRSIPAPYTIFLSLFGVRGVSAQINRWHNGVVYPYRSDRLILPELVIDTVDAASSPEIILKPLFDLMWNAFGHYGSPSYDKTGNYAPQ